MTPFEFFIDDLDGKGTIGVCYSDGSTKTIGRVLVPQTLTDELLEEIIEMINDSLDSKEQE